MIVAARLSPLAAASVTAVSVASKSFSRNLSSTPPKPSRAGLSVDSVDVACSAAGSVCAGACWTGMANKITQAKRHAIKRADTKRIREGPRQDCWGDGGDEPPSPFIVTLDRFARERHAPPHLLVLTL